MPDDRAAAQPGRSDSIGPSSRTGPVDPASPDSPGSVGSPGRGPEPEGQAASRARIPTDEGASGSTRQIPQIGSGELPADRSAAAGSGETQIGGSDSDAGRTPLWIWFLLILAAIGILFTPRLRAAKSTDYEVVARPHPERRWVSAPRFDGLDYQLDIRLRGSRDPGHQTLTEN